MQVCSMRRVFFTILASLLLKGAAAQLTNNHFLQESLRKKPVLSAISSTATPEQPPLPNPQRPALRPQSISPDFYARYMAWTCRQELKMQQAIKLPLYLRLGNLDHVNRLEGKLP